MTKTFNKLGLEEDFYNLIKGIYAKSTTNIILNDERLTSLTVRLGTRQGC